MKVRHKKNEFMLLQKYARYFTNKLIKNGFMDNS